MNHSQQLEQSLGKWTELICTPNININMIVSVMIKYFRSVLHSCQWQAK